MHTVINHEVTNTAYRVTFLQADLLDPSPGLTAWWASRSLVSKMPRELQMTFPASHTNRDLLESLPFAVTQMMNAKSKDVMDVSTVAQALQTVMSDYFDVAGYMTFRSTLPQAAITRLALTGIGSERALDKTLELFGLSWPQSPSLRNLTIIHISASTADKVKADAAYALFKASNESYSHTYALDMGLPSLVKVRQRVEHEERTLGI